MKYYDVFYGTKECITIDADSWTFLRDARCATFYTKSRITAVVNIDNVTAIIEGDTDDDLENLCYTQDAQKEQEVNGNETQEKPEEQGSFC